MKASVIIPIWNGRKYLPSCLDALLAQEYPDLEVIVVDNASTDNSADLVAEQYPQVHLIRNRSNLGFAGGCNVGLQTAQGDMLVLLNQDTVVRPGWLRALVRALQKPEVGVVGCKILYPDGTTIQHAGGWIEWPLGLAHHYGQGERDNGQWDEPRQVDYVTGAAMGFRRDLLERVGLLDEDFWPAYFEDTDFCFRAREAGYEVWYVPDAVLFHVESTSIGNEAKMSLAYQQGRLRFVLKHMPPHRFLEEFIPAEIEYQRLLPQRPFRNMLRLAYLETIPTAASCLGRQWSVDKKTQKAVLGALQNLHRQMWREDWQRLADVMILSSPAPIPTSPSSTLTAPFPPLQEFTFRSSIPVLGPMIAWIRNLWYSIAARWGIRYLIQQQEGINQRVANSIYALEQRIAMLRADNASLAREVMYAYTLVDALEQMISILTTAYDVLLAEEITHVLKQLHSNEE